MSTRDRIYQRGKKAEWMMMMRLRVVCSFLKRRQGVCLRRTKEEGELMMDEMGGDGDGDGGERARYSF